MSSEDKSDSEEEPGTEEGWTNGGTEIIEEAKEGRREDGGGRRQTGIGSIRSHYISQSNTHTHLL